MSQHRRRYKMKELLAKSGERPALRPLQHFHFNYLLFFPILVSGAMVDPPFAHTDGKRKQSQPRLVSNSLLLPACFQFDVRSAARALGPQSGVGPSCRRPARTGAR